MDTAKALVNRSNRFGKKTDRRHTIHRALRCMEETRNDYSKQTEQSP